MLYASARDCLNILNILDITSDPFDIAFDCVEHAASASIRRRRFSPQILSIAVTPRERSV
jgi:hypothetical protein